MTDPRTYGLTTRAAELLAVIRAWKRMEGIVPSYEDLACDLGVRSKATVHRLVTQLEERGLIRRLPGKAQSIELNELHAISLPEDVVLTLRHAARAAGRTPEEHVAALVRHHCPSPSPF